MRHQAFTNPPDHESVYQIIEFGPKIIC